MINLFVFDETAKVGSKVKNVSSMVLIKEAIELD